MLRLLQFLWFGHVHKWGEPFSQVRVFEIGGDEQRPRWHDYYARCEKCGELRRFRL